MWELYSFLWLNNIPLWAPQVAIVIKNLPDNAEDKEMWVWPLGGDDPLGECMATHSNILAWRSPRDTGAWRTTVHSVAKSWTQPKQLSTQYSTVWLDQILFTQYGVFLKSVVPSMLFPTFLWIIEAEGPRSTKFPDFGSYFPQLIPDWHVLRTCIPLLCMEKTSSFMKL